MDSKRFSGVLRGVVYSFDPDNDSGIILTKLGHIVKFCSSGYSCWRQIGKERSRFRNVTPGDYVMFLVDVDGDDLLAKHFIYRDA